MYRNCVKRALAIVLSLVGILTLGWLLILLSIAIKLDSPGPVLFRQKRVGLNKSHFYILQKIFHKTIYTSYYIFAFFAILLAFFKI